MNNDLCQRNMWEMPHSTLLTMFIHQSARHNFSRSKLLRWNAENGTSQTYFKIVWVCY